MGRFWFILPFLIVFAFNIKLSDQRVLNSTSQIFTFSDPKSFLEIRPTKWPLPQTRSLSFKFRTDRPHGLLLYHGLIHVPAGDAPYYELYLTLEKGELKIIHIFSKNATQEVFYIGKGLNRDKWHKVMLEIQPEIGQLTAQVDDIHWTKDVPSLKRTSHYGYKDFDLATHLYFGGTDPKNPIWFHQYNYVPFVGCLGEIQLGTSLASPAPEAIASSRGLQYGCVDSCYKRDPCLHDGRCVNHYTHISCDCFGTNYEDYGCERDNITVVTLRGYSHITYKIYDWKDRAHSDVNRISLQFKTEFPNSVLFYGLGEHPTVNYMSAQLLNGRLEFEINFGDKDHFFQFGERLNDGLWHNFTVYHHGKLIRASLDKDSQEQIIEGENHHLHLDPELYIGAAPANNRSIKTYNKFVGCIKSFYFNQDNVLLALHKGKLNAQYHDVFPPEYGCSTVDIVPFTFPSVRSVLKIDVVDPNKFNFALDFKTSNSDAVIAHGRVRTENLNSGNWLIHLKEGSVFFSINPDSPEPGKSWSINKGENMADGSWHTAQVSFDKGEVTLTVDYRLKATETYIYTIEFLSPFYVGSLTTGDTTKGFVGCIRDVKLQGKELDPRELVANNPEGKVTLDNCQLIDPCANPQACEHGGKCSVVNDRVQCDCKGTGYNGKSCHFSLYKRTCEDLYLVGYRKSGVYKIDIDRNGPLPPAHVFCKMESEDSIITEVINNVQTEMVIRSRTMGDFSFNVTYREFTPAMLRSLIAHSHRCYQDVKYDCKRAALGLGSYLWMESVYPDRYIARFGGKRDGQCTCANNRSCPDPSLFCNCDIMDEMWRKDEARLTDPKIVGISRVYVLQPPHMNPASEGRLTIGPLKCIETNTQQYVITFKTVHSYLEVPGWHSGDLAFSFRTSNSHVVLIYQASLHPNHGYFKVVLEDDYHLRFDYFISGVKTSLTLASPKRLNSGEWQQVWVDHDAHHMRFTVNLQEKMVDLNPGEEFGPFEGQLYIGSTPKGHKNGDEGGFIGCFRGLVTNDEVVDVYKYVPKNSLSIVTGCQPSCSPNPCKNGAECLELWGSYECKCKNPVAHSGKNCETNINENAMTFVTPKAYYPKTYQGNELEEALAQGLDILSEDILLNFRTYQQTALLLYAFDHTNNFVQLHIEGGSRVVFTFNSHRTIVQEGVDVPSGISNGRPVQVQVDREKDKTVLVVDGKYKAAINQPINLVDKYEQKPWREGQEKELVLPGRLAVETVQHRQLLLGGVDEIGMQSKLPGFVGCLQGLKIGQVVFDLKKAADESSDREGIIRPGCNMQCDHKPCKNGGSCIEDWVNNKTSCDCMMTSYRGEVCGNEIGGHFDGKSYLKYPFDSGPSSTNFISAHLAFSTSAKISTPRVLLYVIHSPSSKYLLISLMPHRGLVIEEGHGTTVVVNTTNYKKGGYADEHRHWLSYTHKKGEKPQLIIDGVVDHSIAGNFDELFTVDDSGQNVVVVGGIEEKADRFANYGNFVGCISNVFVKVGDIEAKPLEIFFGYVQDKSTESVKQTGAVTEGKCADFGFALPFGVDEISPEPPEVSGPAWKVEPPKMTPYVADSEHTRIKTLREVTMESARVATIMGVMLLLVLIGVGLYVWHLDKSHKRQKFLEDVKFFPGNRNSSTKSKQGVTFNTNHSYMEMKDAPESHPLQEAPLLGDARKNSYSKNNNEISYAPPSESNDKNDEEASETTPLKSSQSQELEWDPAADNQQLISTAMNEMDPTEGDSDIGSPDEQAAQSQEPPQDRKDSISRPLAPLASASEVTINLHQ